MALYSFEYGLEFSFDQMVLLVGGFDINWYDSQVDEEVSRRVSY